MTSTGNLDRIVQIHPTRRCNLRCLHCYSSSSPEERDQLSVETLLQAITDASQEGYKVASFSGGEPLVYKPLLELLTHARQCQMRTTITSNGMLLDERHLEKIGNVVDLIAISLDGMPASHNRMRASEQAFETMAARLEGLRKCGIPFGFIFTLTQHNFRELDWVANFAVEQGASLLQIHPLENVGRAQQNLAKIRPNRDHLGYTYLKAMRLRESVGDRIYIQVDIAHQAYLRAYPSTVYAGVLPEAQNGGLAEIISPLIIEADGTVVPVQHGFAREYSLGNLQQAPLPELAINWRQQRYAAFLKLCSKVYEEVTAPAELPITDWYEAVARHAENAHVF